MQSEHDLTRMMQAYGTQLLRLCTLYLKDRALAEDAVQETFVRAWGGQISVGNAAKRPF